MPAPPLDWGWVDPPLHHSSEFALYSRGGSRVKRGNCPAGAVGQPPHRYVIHRMCKPSRNGTHSRRPGVSQPEGHPLSTRASLSVSDSARVFSFLRGDTECFLTSTVFASPWELLAMEKTTPQRGWSVFCFFSSAARPPQGDHLRLPVSLNRMGFGHP